MKNTALKYIRRGWSPIPIPHRSKAPILSEWQNLRLTAENVDEYFNSNDPINIGVLLGKPSKNLVDVDIDCPEAQIAAPYFLPSTASVFGRVGKPSSHRLYISEIPKTMQFADSSKEGNMLLELRSTGTQTVFPGSHHQGTGEPILWDEGKDEEPTAIAPNDLIRAVSLTASAALIAKHWPNGNRQGAALALAGALKGSGWPLENTDTFISSVCAAAGDDETEKRLQCISSTYEKNRTTGWPTLAKVLGADIVDAVQRWIMPGKVPTGQLETISLTNIKKERIDWLWPRYVPKGALTLVYGDSGVGKSHIMASMASTVSRGGKWPVTHDKCEIGSVLFIDIENPAATVLVPKLSAAGADLNKCSLTTRVKENKNGKIYKEYIDFNIHVDIIENAIREISDLSMIVIDPITDFIGETDTNNNTEVRRVMGYINDLCQRCGIAAVVVSHVNKNATLSASSRAIGSMGFISSARSTLIVAEDRENPKRYIMVPGKSNLGERGEPLAYAIIKIPDEINGTCCGWEEHYAETTAEELLAPREFKTPKKRDSSKALLVTWLKEGPVAVNKIEDLANKADIGWRTIEKAKKDLGVVSRKTKEGWEWFLVV